MRAPGELALIAAIADDLPAGVWVATVPDGSFVYANRAFQEIMGMGPVVDAAVGGYAEPYGIFASDGKPYPEDRMPFVRAMRDKSTVVADDIVIHRRDASRVYVRAFAKPMFDGAGAMTHVAIAFFDISLEVEARVARERAQAQLVQVERLASIGMLAAGVAHEINNPLAYVVGSLEIIAREIAEAGTGDARLAAIDEKVKNALHGVGRVRNIVRDLKMFSHARDQRPSAVDVRAAIESSLSIANNEIRHRARVERDLRPVPPVWAEEGRIGQLLLNLVVNAAQAIDAGAIDENCVRVATGTDAAGWAVIEVADTGGGIAPEVLPHIFDPFFTTKPAGLGTGLGLSICHSIVTGLGGRIEVDSEPGRGTTFRVLLPPQDFGSAANRSI